MDNLLVRTNGNADPKGKPRVYFTCHPDDVDTCLDAVCEELCAAHDCAIYYREDMSVPLPEETRDTDLGRMNLFVIPEHRISLPSIIQKSSSIISAVF